MNQYPEAQVFSPLPKNLLLFGLSPASCLWSCTPSEHKSPMVSSLQAGCLNQLKNDWKEKIKLTYKALKKPSKWLPLLRLLEGGFLWSISSVLDGGGLGCLLLPGVWLLPGFLFAAFLLAQLHFRLLVFWTLFALLAHRFTFSWGNWSLCGV